MNKNSRNFTNVDTPLKRTLEEMVKILQKIQKSLSDIVKREDSDPTTTNRRTDGINNLKENTLKLLCRFKIRILVSQMFLVIAIILMILLIIGIICVFLGVCQILNIGTNTINCESFTDVPGLNILLCLLLFIILCGIVLAARKKRCNQIVLSKLRLLIMRIKIDENNDLIKLYRIDRELEMIYRIHDS